MMAVAREDISYEFLETAAPSTGQLHQPRFSISSEKFVRDGRHQEAFGSAASGLDDNRGARRWLHPAVQY